ncbi:hypothetical protein ACO0QE_002055 [Hanseniaspora vineae]
MSNFTSGMSTTMKSNSANKASNMPTHKPSITTNNRTTNTSNGNIKTSGSIKTPKQQINNNTANNSIKVQKNPLLSNLKEKSVNQIELENNKNKELSGISGKKDLVDNIVVIKVEEKGKSSSNGTTSFTDKKVVKSNNENSKVTKIDCAPPPSSSASSGLTQKGMSVDSDVQEVQEVQEVQDVQDVQEVQDVQDVQKNNKQTSSIRNVKEQNSDKNSDKPQMSSSKTTETVTALPIVQHTLVGNANKIATKQETKPMNKRLLKKNINAMKTENINLKKELGGLIESLQALKHQFNVINQQIYQKQLASTSDATNKVSSNSLNNLKTTHKAQDLNRKRSYMDVDDSNVYGQTISIHNDYDNVFDSENKENPAYTEQLTDIFLKFEDENDFPLTTGDGKSDSNVAAHHEMEQDHESSGNTPNSLFSVYPSTSSSLNTTGMNSTANINSTKHHPTLNININTTNDTKAIGIASRSRPNSGNQSPATSHNTHYSASVCSPSSSISSLFQTSNNVSTTASVSGGTSLSRSTSMMNVDTSSSATTTTNNSHYYQQQQQHHHHHSLSSHPQMRFLNDFEEKEFMKKYPHLNNTHHRHSVPQPRIHAKPHAHQLQFQSTTTSLGSSPAAHFQSDDENKNSHFHSAALNANKNSNGENELLIDAQTHVLENIKEEQEFMTAGLSKNLTSLTSFTNLTNLTNLDMMNGEKNLDFYNSKDTGLLAFETAKDDIQMSLEDVLGDVVDVHAHDEDDIDMDFLKF